MKITRTIITVLLEILSGLLLSILNILSLGCLQLCQYEGRLLLEYYYFIPVTCILVIYVFLYTKYKETDKKAGLLIIEFMLLCGNILFISISPVPLNCLIDSTAARLYSALYYFLIVCDLMVPFVFFFRIIQRLTSEKRK